MGNTKTRNTPQHRLSRTQDMKPAQIPDIPEEEYTKGMRLRLASKMGWTEERMHKTISEYFRFISLVMLHSKGEMTLEVTPSQDIDETWHNHMLFTRSYISFCNKYNNGEYIHHQPSYRDDGSRPGGFDASLSREENNRILLAAFRQTREAYKHAFGAEAPEEVWGTAGECCSPCNGGGRPDL